MGTLLTWIGGVVLGVVFLVVAGGIRSRARYPEEVAGMVLGLRGIGVLVVLATVMFAVTTVVVVVPPTHRAVMKNSFTGDARFASSGWRVINPIVEEVVKYDMRLQEFQIGRPNKVDGAGNIVEMLAVDAGADSPGLPLVYLVTTARVRYSIAGCPGAECDLVDIELRYGKQKWSDLVLDRMEMNTREVAGRNPYDYVGKQRDAFAEDVAVELRADMEGLAEFDYVGIPWYDFSQFINAQLDQVAEREREIERRTQEVEISKQEQQKQMVDQETAVMVARRQADAAVAVAQGEKQSAILRAEGEAEALRLVGAQLKLNPLLIEYAKAEGWDGKLPTMMGVGPVPFFNVESE